MDKPKAEKLHKMGRKRGWVKGKEEGLREGEAKGGIQSKLRDVVALLGILDDTAIASALFVPIEIVKWLRAGDDIERFKEALLAESMMSSIDSQ